MSKWNFFRAVIFSILCLSIISFAQISVFKSEAKTKTSTQNKIPKQISNSFLNTFQTDSVLKNLTNASSVIAIDDETQKAHTLVGGYYDLFRFPNAKILLNNKSPEAIEVKPILYRTSSPGFEVPIITVPANSQQYIRIQDWVNLVGGSFNQGHIKLLHRGKDRVIGSQIFLQDETKSLSYEFKMEQLSLLNAIELDAVWYMPSIDAEAEVVLVNLRGSVENIKVTLSAEPADPNIPKYTSKTVQLTPYQTKILNVKTDFGEIGTILANQEALSVNISDTSIDSLMAKVLITDETKGYSNIANFSNPNTAESNTYHGVGLQLGTIGNDDLKPFVVMKNVTNNIIIVDMKIPYMETDKTRGLIQLPSITLAPRQIYRANMLPVEILNNIATAGLEIAYSGQPGSIVASAHSVSDSGTHVFHNQMVDAVAQKSPSGSYPFDISGTNETNAYLKNVTVGKEDYFSYITWENGGIYDLGTKPIYASQTIEIDVKYLRDNQIPDVNGNIIPSTVTTGQIQWSLKRKESTPQAALANKVPMLGQIFQSSASKGEHSSYSSQNYCENNGRVKVSPENRTISYGHGTQFYAEATRYDAYGNIIWGPYDVTEDADWESDDEDIATVDDGYVTTHGLGKVEIKAKYRTNDHYYYPPCEQGQGGPFFFENESNLFEKSDDGAKENQEEENTSNLSQPCDCICYNNPHTDQSNLTIKPTVDSLSASVQALRSTPNSTGTESITTYNESLTFTNSDDDIFVGFKGGYDIKVTAGGINPPQEASNLKWLIKNSETNGGIPTFSQTQQGNSNYITITPNREGHFHVILWHDTNNSDEFDTGEQLKVLRLSIAKAEIIDCKMTIKNDFKVDIDSFFTQIDTTDHENGVKSACKIKLTSGGQNKKVGLSKIVLGPVSNIVSTPSASIGYGVGTAMVKGVEKVDSFDSDYPALAFTIGSLQQGGDKIFRTLREDNAPEVPSSGGLVINAGFNNNQMGIGFNNVHPGTAETWVNTGGDLLFDEYIVGFFSETPNSYVVFSKIDWKVSFEGQRDLDGNWERGGANITVRNESPEIGAELTKDFVSLIGSGGTAKKVEETQAYLLHKRKFVRYRNEFTPKPINITTTELSSGIVNTPYSQQICAEEGLTPYTWDVDGKKLPPGTSLENSGTPCTTISGIPEEQGTYTFLVVAVGGSTDIDQFSITIDPAQE